MKELGLSQAKIKEISRIKGEPKWMLDFRLNFYKKFLELSNPTFGPELKVDFKTINFYKRVVDEIKDDWNKLPCEITNTFNKIGLIDAE